MSEFNNKMEYDSSNANPSASAPIILQPPLVQQHAMVYNPLQFAQPMSVGPDAAEMTCPSCRANIKTTRRYKSTASTHILAILLCGVCCCCVPYCCDSCRKVNHFCPLCNVFIGTYG